MTEEFVKLGPKSEIPAGGVKSYTHAGQEIAVCNLQGEYYAISDICTHARAKLSEGELQGSEITCPLHGARFDVKTGKALSLPAVRPLATYQLETRGDDLWAKIPSP